VSQVFIIVHAEDSEVNASDLGDIEEDEQLDQGGEQEDGGQHHVLHGLAVDQGDSEIGQEYQNY
jgi:hypothetical protein